MKDFKLSIFPQPALVHFLIKFGGYNPAAVKYLPVEELLMTIENDPSVINQLGNLIEKQPIYQDELFLRTWKKAFFDFPECNKGCLKMRFYAMVVWKDGIVAAESYNKRITNLFGKDRFCDESSCIREKIKNRTEQAIGDCGHAIIWCLSDLWQKSPFKPHEINRLMKIYESGFNVKDFGPWISSDISYTCLQCMNDFAIFGIKSVYAVKYIDGIAQWVEIKVRDDFYQCAEYALVQKKA